MKTYKRIKFSLLPLFKFSTLYTKEDHCVWKNTGGGAHDVMVIVIGNGHGDKSSNPGLDCISHNTNILGKGMNPIILPPAMDR